MKISQSNHQQGENVKIEAESINFLDAPKLKELFDAFNLSPSMDLNLDLSDVFMMDSSAVGILLSYYRKFVEKGKSMKIVSVSRQLLGIFKLMKVERLLCIPLDN